MKIRKVNKSIVLGLVILLSSVWDWAAPAQLNSVKVKEANN